MKDNKSETSSAAASFWKTSEALLSHQEEEKRSTSPRCHPLAQERSCRTESGGNVRKSRRTPMTRSPTPQMRSPRSRCLGRTGNKHCLGGSLVFSLRTAMGKTRRFPSPYWWPGCSWWRRDHPGLHLQLGIQWEGRCGRHSLLGCSSHWRTHCWHHHP